MPELGEMLLHFPSHFNILQFLYFHKRNLMQLIKCHNEDVLSAAGSLLDLLLIHEREYRGFCEGCNRL